VFNTTMVSKLTLSRLKKELKFMHDEPPELIHARPDEKNMLIWHYLLQGPPDTVFDGGWYWGRLRFPKNYPMGPPTITMTTPNGRFEINKRLCLSMSDFHPETWEPSWTISTVLTGLLSFMCEDTRTAGSIETTSSVKKRFAKDSVEYNSSQEEFTLIYPDFEDIMREAASSSKKPAKKAIDDEPIIAPTDSKLEASDEEETFYDMEEKVDKAEKAEVKKTRPEAEVIEQRIPGVDDAARGTAEVPNKSKVLIQGLRSKEHFNGMEGEVFGMKEGRYKVRVNGTALGLKRNNFTLVH